MFIGVWSNLLTSVCRKRLLLSLSSRRGNRLSISVSTIGPFAVWKIGTATSQNHLVWACNRSETWRKNWFLARFPLTSFGEIRERLLRRQYFKRICYYNFSKVTHASRASPRQTADSTKYRVRLKPNRWLVANWLPVLTQYGNLHTRIGLHDQITIDWED